MYVLAKTCTALFTGSDSANCKVVQSLGMLSSSLVSCIQDQPMPQNWRWIQNSPLWYSLPGSKTPKKIRMVIQGSSNGHSMVIQPGPTPIIAASRPGAGTASCESCTVSASMAVPPSRRKLGKEKNGCSGHGVWTSPKFVSTSKTAIWVCLKMG